jgi:hypothetical protein
MISPPMIIALQEIWIPDNTNKNLNGYSPLIAETRTGNNNCGGGVGLFVKNQTISKPLNSISPTFQPHICEIQFIELTDNKIIIGNLYKPPKATIDTFITHLDAALKDVTNYAKHKFDIILGGDFNINLLDSTEATESLLNIMEKYSLKPLIKHPTRINSNNATLIDNIFIKTKKEYSSGVILTDISDHLGIFCAQPKKEKPKQKQAVKKTRIFNSKNISTLKSLLKAEDWGSIDEAKPEAAFKVFHTIIKDSINIACPEKSQNFKHQRKKEEWMTQGLLISRKNKEKQLKKLTTTQSKATLDKYQYYSKLYYKLIKKAKSNHYRAMLKIHFNNTREIWSLTNKYLNRTAARLSPPIELTLNNRKITGEKNVAETFNKYFTDIGTELAKEINFEPDAFKQYLKSKISTTLSIQSINESQLDEVIKSLKQKTSMGWDNISNQLLKQIYPEIKQPLLKLINYSIVKGYVPAEWKLAKIVPIHKSGPMDNCGNYRPISLLPTISKVIEKIVNSQVLNYMEQNNLLHPNQYGFRLKHDTINAITKAIDVINTNTKLNNKTIAVFCDLKKAFDTVNHSILLKKLDYYGINNKWFKSYLTGRYQYTEISGTKSKQSFISCGVPQGSILGPLLFLIYINDLPLANRFTNILFADDTTFLISAENNESLIQKTNNELEKAAKWFSHNALTIHPQKTMFMIFNSKDKLYFNNKIILNGTNLERIGEDEKTKSIKFVGILIDENLKWNHHIKAIINKISQNSYLISAHKKQIPMHIRTMLYNSLIKPHLEYGITVWGFSNIKALTTKQKKILRHVANVKNHSCHTTKLFAKLKIIKLEDLLKINIAKIVSKFFNNELPIPISNIFELKKSARNTRTTKNLNLEPRLAKTKKEENNIYFKAPIIWNSLDEKVKTESPDKIGKTIKNKTIFYYQLEPPCMKKICYSCKNK